MYLNEPIMAVSICAPVFDKQAVWRGVNCMDQNLKSDLQKYWNIDFVESEEDNFFIISNPDPVLETVDSLY